MLPVATTVGSGEQPPVSEATYICWLATGFTATVTALPPWGTLGWNCLTAPQDMHSSDADITRGKRCVRGFTVNLQSGVLAGTGIFPHFSAKEKSRTPCAQALFRW